jgi:hypothetical protein
MPKPPPPGTRLVGEVERLKTLDELNDARNEIINLLKEFQDQSSIRQNYQKDRLE